MTNQEIFIGEKFLGNAIDAKKSDKEIIFTFEGDFPGMAEKNIIIPNGNIIYEDNKRMYIEY